MHRGWLVETQATKILAGKFALNKVRENVASHFKMLGYERDRQNKGRRQAVPPVSQPFQARVGTEPIEAEQQATPDLAAVGQAGFDTIEMW